MQRKGRPVPVSSFVSLVAPLFLVIMLVSLCTAETPLAPGLGTAAQADSGALAAPESRRFLTEQDRLSLQEMLRTHLNYFLSQEAIASSGLPLGAYKEGDRGRYGYSNPTEWGYALLAWMVAFETGKIDGADASARMTKALGTLLSLQADPSQNYGTLFYPYYYVTERDGSDRAVPSHDADTNIPSIDNGFLYTSLHILQGWAGARGFAVIEAAARTVKDRMNFRMFLKEEHGSLYMAHTMDAATGLPGSPKWDVYADEGGAMAWIAYLSGSVSFDEYTGLVKTMIAPPKTWNGITVDEAPWFNAMFTWGVRSWAGFPVADWELNQPNGFSRASFAPAVKAHLAYGQSIGFHYPAFSDAMTQTGMVRRYTPPNIPRTIPADVPGHVTPHALFVPFCIGPDLEPAVVATLMMKIRDLQGDRAGYYHDGRDGHKPFGFEVTASPYKDAIGYGGVEARYVYETLSHAYTVLSLFQGLRINDGMPTLLSFASHVPGYLTKVEEALSLLYPPVRRTLRVPQDYRAIQQAVDAAFRGDVIAVSAGDYSENVSLRNKPKVTVRGVIQDHDDPFNATANTVIRSMNSLSGPIIGVHRYSDGATLQQLVITGANGDYWQGWGGVLLEDVDNASVTDSVIAGNRGPRGGGLSSLRSSAFIARNMFRQNDGHWGGAMSIDENHGTTIIDNEVANNMAWESGAGIRTANSTVSIMRNRVYGNVSDYAGGLAVYASRGEIRNNLIVGNQADFRDGGGITADGSPMEIGNNVIHRNSDCCGMGGILIRGDAVPVVTNNIITGNTGGIACPDGSASPVLRYNNVHDNTLRAGDEDYKNCRPGPGALSSDPLFAAPDSDGSPHNDDYHLQPGSPCRDAGDPAVRFHDRDCSRNDMGIYGGPSADPGDTAPPVFVDIPPGHWAGEYVNALYCNAVTQGCAQQPLMYCPAQNVSRQAMAAFIIRALYGEGFAHTMTPHFTDVSAASRFFSYIQRMKDDGITTGCGGTTYCPGAGVTRQAMAAFIIRAIYGEEFGYTSAPYFADVPASSPFFRYVQKMRDEGITTGCNAPANTMYCPVNLVNRASMAAFLARAFLGMQ